MCYFQSCSHFTHQTYSRDNPLDSNLSSADPNYNVSLDFDYQDFTSYLFMGNRVENFTAYFNTFFKSKQDYDEAFDEYRSSLISVYNRKLDSLNMTVPVSGNVKEKLDKAIERSSKIIQFHKNSKFIDDAVLIIGKSYYLLTDYFKAERTFNEFLSKFSSSVLADEAILYLGRTKVKLDKITDAETIFKNLVKNSPDNEIKSLAARDLGVLAFNKHNFQESVDFFRASIDFSRDSERKAEGQFILAKILSRYKPELAANEYKKVLDYASGYDLEFYARLNYAKGLLFNKNFAKADEELTSLRKKYRDDQAFTPLVDLEIANNLYAQKKYRDAKEKYYEVIVRYPNTVASSDSYYHLAKHEEDVNNDYLNALINYKKASEENGSSDYYKESMAKTATLEKYFTLLRNVDGSDSVAFEIPTVNLEVEKYRQYYNEERGIEQQQQNEQNREFEKQSEDDGRQTGDGKGKPGGRKELIAQRDSLEGEKKEEPTGPSGPSGPSGPINNPGKGNVENTDSSGVINTDSLKAIQDSIEAKASEDKIFNSYYELAELFMYNLDRNDSAEYYLKLLVEKFPESERQAKILYTLGNFYKNIGNQSEAEKTLNKIITTYPNSVYAIESKKILGLTTGGEVVASQDPSTAIFSEALNLFNEKKYPETIDKLRTVEEKHPGDSAVAKSIYFIGYVYENVLVNKDSAIFYYKKLKERFPESAYTQRINPILEYVASIEPPPSDTTKVNTAATDSTGTKTPEAPPEEGRDKEKIEENKPENGEEVSIDTTKAGNENQLSQEELEKLLKEAEEPK